MFDNCKGQDKGDFSQDTWLSLLGLLNPSEFFVTIDHFPVWRRHLAWAKSDGDDLQKHTTQQFATNMVFMSLLLGAELNVLFNSSPLTTDMRRSMQHEEYHKLKFWIGVVILVSVFVTIIALVCTFTAWRMVSAVSAANAHCILRSSIGQYVTHMPSRLIVAALYSFLLWMVLFLIDMLSGPLCFILFCVIAVLFAQLIISYSAFGRLVIHTGAMGKKPILDADLEQSLLPSGLHAWLLIKATNHAHHRTSVTTQYRPKLQRTTSGGSKKSQGSELSLRPGIDRKKSSAPIQHNNLTADDEMLILKTAETLSLRSIPKPDSSRSLRSVSPIPMSNPGSKPSLDVIDVIPSRETSDETDKESDTDEEKEGERDVEHRTEIKHVTPEFNRSDPSSNAFSKFPLEKQRSKLFSNMNRRKSIKLREEWQDESDCRMIYDLPPPPEPPNENESSEEEDSLDEHELGLMMPRASILNRTRRMSSLRNLAKETVNRASQSTENLMSLSRQSKLERGSSNDSFASGLLSHFRRGRDSPTPCDDSDSTSFRESSSSWNYGEDKSSDLNDSARGRRVNFSRSMRRDAVHLDRIDSETFGLLKDQQVPHYSSNVEALP